MKKFLTVVILLGIFIISSFAESFNGEYTLSVKVKDIKDVNLLCDIVYRIIPSRTNTDSLILLTLPFGNNPNMIINTENRLNQEPILFGFYPNQNKGLCILTSNSNKAEIKIEFKNVALPFQKAVDFENAISLNINCKNNGIGEAYENVLKLNLKKVFIETENIAYSKPEFKSIVNETRKYEIGIDEQQEVYWIMNLPKESFLMLFIGLFVANFLVGIFGAPKFVKEKSKTILILITCIVLFLISIIFFFKQVLPTRFVEDTTVLVFFGFFSGWIVGILIFSIHNLLAILRIEKHIDKKR